jgi:F-type H+-transporting ATPase subunit b
VSITVTLLIQIVAFVLLIWFVNKYLWTPLSGLLEERQKKIADGLSAAEKGKKELELAEQRAKDVLKEAKQQAQELLAQAEKRGAEIVDQAKVKAEAEVEKTKAAALAEIGQEVSRAKETLRKEVGAMEFAGAEKILAREVDRAAHDSMVNQLIEKL